MVAIRALLDVPFEQAVLLAPFTSMRWELVRAAWSKLRREALGVVALSPLSFVLVLIRWSSRRSATWHPRGRSASSAS